MIELHLEPGEPEKPVIDSEHIYIPKVHGTLYTITIDSSKFYNSNDILLYQLIADYNDEYLILNQHNFHQEINEVIDIRNTDKDRWFYYPDTGTTEYFPRKNTYADWTQTTTAWTGINHQEIIEAVDEMIAQIGNDFGEITNNNDNNDVD